MTSRGYLGGLYEDAMDRAYGRARLAVAEVMEPGVRVLDCGASSGFEFDRVGALSSIRAEDYVGLEWSRRLVDQGRARGLDVRQADLNAPLSLPDAEFGCVFGLSVLEHLTNPCRHLREVHRVLRPGGRLVLLTPNISTLFTIALLIMGRMPSSGPHPDSLQLMETVGVNVKPETRKDVERDTPEHRHMIVFSFRALREFLGLAGFDITWSGAFGLYPFPRQIQPLLERIDPYHCHQMVFVARKRAH